MKNIFRGKSSEYKMGKQEFFEGMISEIKKSDNEEEEEDEEDEFLVSDLSPSFR